MTIVLASKSASRRAMLTDAGVAFRAEAAQVDERAIERGLGDAAPADVALALARAKALAVCALVPGQVVLGSDSLVACDGRRFDKPADRDEAAAHLAFFSGRTMTLHSAFALARDGAVLAEGADAARLHVRALSPAFVEAYLDAEWPAVAGCVGVFRIEAMGVQLFEAVEGDHWTVLGMPLIKVLAALRELGELAA